MLWTRKVVNSDSTLRREIPHRRSSRSPLRYEDVRRELVGRVDESACSLKPWLYARGVCQEIPAENDRRDACPGEGSPTDRVDVRLALILERLVVRSRRVRLPERHDVPRQFKLAAENACVKRRREYLSYLTAGGKEPELRPISADAIAEVHKWSVLPAAITPHLSYGRLSFCAGALGRGGNTRAHAQHHHQ